MQTYTPLWLRRRAQVLNPHNPRHEQIGMIVTEPERQCVVVRWPDGMQTEHGLVTLRVLPEDAVGAADIEETTDDLDHGAQPMIYDAATQTHRGTLTGVGTWTFRPIRSRASSNRPGAEVYDYATQTWKPLDIEETTDPDSATQDQE